MCKANLTGSLVEWPEKASLECPIETIWTTDFACQPSIGRHTNGVNYFTYMPSDPKKIQALRASGTLNPHPEKVRNARFAEREFFDPNDLVQLKYETLRAVEMDGESLSAAAAQSGLSRPTVYEAQTHFQTHGMEGLLPKKRGPKSPRKLKPEVREFLDQALSSEPELRSNELVQKVRQRFGMDIHPRTLEKALKKAKRGRQTPPANQP
jgi:transposase